MIDRVVSLGYADSHPIWRVSPRLRKFRKAAAKMTGLHGVLSGKPHVSSALKTSSSNDYLGSVRRRLTAIERARRNIERSSTAAANLTGHRNLLFWKHGDDIEEPEHRFGFFSKKSSTKNLAEKQRLNRVKEIDEQMQKAQLQLSQLAYEKDMLQRRPNPLWNYTMGGLPDPSKNETIPDAHFNGSITATRQFSFPPSDLVVEYLDMLFASGRLVRLNHTDLWRNGDSDDYEDELTSPMKRDDERRKKSANGDSGNWLLRNVIGSKLGETTETAAYKAVCAGLMSFLAKSISTLHGVNVMTYSDIRLWTEYAPALPTLSAGIIPGIGQNRNYAEEAFQDAMRRGAKKKRPNKRTDNFIQREAVIETLISQCQIAAPLLKLFPLAWQRAMLGNIVIMATAIISDFCEGIEFQILGHRLSLAFSPITEEDMMRGMVKDSYNNPSRINPELFEAAVRATADSVSENLNFLDRWHERALGSDLLRTQIATLIARLVLTLTDDALRGSRLDLWAVHAGGPRLMANLEYRAVPRSGE